MANERRRSSLFNRASNSFIRSKGERGADVDTMRGTAGADFESEAIVTRGNTGGGLFSCLGFLRKQSNSYKYILVKGPYVFVYSNQYAPAPSYAIPLKHQTCNVHEVKAHTQIVALENALGDIEYEFKFDLKENRDLGKNFGRVLEEQIIVGNTTEIKEKLGHDTGFSKSMTFAKKVVNKKEKDQPNVPAASPVAVADDYSLMQAY